ncbi:MAG: FxsA family protein, partial [Alcanivorax sp.]|nr:FxsA family protein [Alcanivorax sp.]
AFFYQSGSFNGGPFGPGGGPFGGGRPNQGSSQGNGVVIDGEAREEPQTPDQLERDQDRR